MATRPPLGFNPCQWIDSLTYAKFSGCNSQARVHSIVPLPVPAQGGQEGILEAQDTAFEASGGRSVHGWIHGWMPELPFRIDFSL